MTSIRTACRRLSGSNRRVPGEFERHVLEIGLPRHATLDVGDIDNDGDIDIVVGNFNAPGQGTVEIFENLRAPQK